MVGRGVENREREPSAKKCALKDSESLGARGHFEKKTACPWLQMQTGKGESQTWALGRNRETVRLRKRRECLAEIPTPHK